MCVMMIIFKVDDVDQGDQGVTVSRAQPVQFHRPSLPFACLLSLNRLIFACFLSLNRLIGAELFTTVADKQDIDSQ